MHEQTNRATDTGVDPTRDAPLTAEASFRIDELFFSRTDSRGRIVAGNEVFQLKWKKYVELKSYFLML